MEGTAAFLVVVGSPFSPPCDAGRGIRTRMGPTLRRPSPSTAPSVAFCARLEAFFVESKG